MIETNIKKECNNCYEIKSTEDFYTGRKVCKLCSSILAKDKRLKFKRIAYGYPSEELDKTYDGSFYTCKTCKVKRPSYRFLLYRSNYNIINDKEYKIKFNLKRCKYCNPLQKNLRLFWDGTQFNINKTYYKLAENDFDAIYIDREYIDEDLLFKNVDWLLKKIKIKKGTLTWREMFELSSYYVDVYASYYKDKMDHHEDLVFMYQKLLEYHKKTLESL
jgi:hypothetical protein